MVAVLLVRDEGSTRKKKAQHAVAHVIYNEINCTLYIYTYIYDLLPRRASFLPQGVVFKVMMMMRSSSKLGTHKAYITPRERRKKNMERNVDEEFTREPFSTRPSDPMRDGLAYKASSSSSASSAHQHPVEQIQNASNPYVLSEQKKNHLANVYGIALPAQMDIERQILQHVERLPNNHTLKSKRVGLEILSGNVDRMDFSDYLGQSDLAPEARTNKTTHEIMEHRLGLGLTGPKGK